MRIVKGNKLVELSREELLALIAGFERVVVDLGCGDGRFVYKNALSVPTTLWVGIEPAIKQTEEFARKIARKKLQNVLFVVGSLEMMPSELNGVADKVFITLPWGSLLGAIAKPTTENIKNIRDCLKVGGELEVIFGYDNELEPNLTSKFELDRIDEAYAKHNILPEFEQNGFDSLACISLYGNDLKEVESTWGKRISITPTRPYFKILARKIF